MTLESHGFVIKSIVGVYSPFIEQYNIFYSKFLKVNELIRNTRILKINFYDIITNNIQV